MLKLSNIFVVVEVAKATPVATGATASFTGTSGTGETNDETTDSRTTDVATNVLSKNSTGAATQRLPTADKIPGNTNQK